MKARLYRGDSALNDAALAEAAHFRARRPAIEAAIRATPHLDAKSADKAVEFIGSFYSEIADDAAVEKLLKRCRS